MQGPWQFQVRHEHVPAQRMSQLRVLFLPFSVEPSQRAIVFDRKRLSKVFLIGLGFSLWWWHPYRTICIETSSGRDTRAESRWGQALDACKKEKNLWYLTNYYKKSQNMLDISLLAWWMSWTNGHTTRLFTNSNLLVQKPIRQLYPCAILGIKTL